MRTIVDVLIVGAGPSGSTAATTLAQLGHSVVIIDKAVFPRHKTCASWINALAFSRFPYLQPELNNLVDCPFYGIRFTTSPSGGTERTTNEDHPDI
jgi:flavin-dependent dehydrogenase